MTFSEKLPVRFPDENTALRIILEGTATETGERFFEALVVNLAKAHNTHSAWVTEFIEETRRLRALGVEETFVYQPYLKTGLAAGQVIVVGTDGIWEACDRDGKMYGQERFRDNIRQNAHRPACGPSSKPFTTM
ncbi:MAG: SpoIIE family protein phosphatase [Desulfobacterales bacterium]